MAKCLWYDGWVRFRPLYRRRRLGRSDHTQCWSYIHTCIHMLVIVVEACKPGERGIGSVETETPKGLSVNCHDHDEMFDPQVMWTVLEPSPRPSHLRQVTSVLPAYGNEVTSSNYLYITVSIELVIKSK